MINQFSRTEMLLGKEAMKKLAHSAVAVFGIGGVGSFTVEALARCGIETLILIDNDIISETNINRQIHAMNKTVGKLKTDVMKKRIVDINSNANVICHEKFILYDNISDIFNQKVDYVVDAVDTVTAKLAIIEKSIELDIPIISCMGTGNKLHPEMLKISDIYSTSVCPLAKVMRHELKKRGIEKLKVCYSEEIPIIPQKTNEISSKRIIPGSISFVPSVAGLIIAGEVIRNIIGQ